VVSSTPRPQFTPGKDPVPIVQEAGWAPGRSGQARKISPPSGIRSPDRPARSQSLYRLSYPAHSICITPKKIAGTVKVWPPVTAGRLMMANFTGVVLYLQTAKVKVKQSRYRHGVAQRVPGSQIS
jgi:hypothetical protein